MRHGTHLVVAILVVLVAACGNHLEGSIGNATADVDDRGFLATFDLTLRLDAEADGLSR